MTDVGEACDEGAANGSGACTSQCQCASGFAAVGGHCVDVDECASNNGGCGDAAFWSCVNHVGAPASCTALAVCTINNGSCGDPSFFSCTEHLGAAPTCATRDLCATNNGGCGDASYFTCTNHVGAASTCGPIDLCANNNGGCGSANYYSCTNHVGAASTCAPIDLCASNNGGCGSATYFSCTNHVGAASSCTSIDLCASNNGGCGSATYFTCTNHVGAASTCASIDLCAANNGGCGNANYFSCTNHVGAASTCAPIDLCASSNGGCGDAAFFSCTNHVGAASTCAPIDLCAANNGGCGSGAFFSCTNHVGAASSCAPIDLCAANNGGCGNSLVFTCSNNVGAPPTCGELPVITLPGSQVSGTVPGLGPTQHATVTLGNDGFLRSQELVGAQPYSFTGLAPGEYFLKVDVVGSVSPKAKRLQVVSAKAAMASVGGDLQLDLPTTPLAAGAFTYHWEEDASRAGQNVTAFVNQPPVIQFLAQTVPVPDLVAADELAHGYNIILSDEQQHWDAEHAYRLLQTMKSIPQVKRSAGAVQTLVPSRWVLTTQNQAGDITVDYGTGAGVSVTVSDAAFVNAAPRLVTLDGVRGTFFSRRLHHALVDYVTHGGNDLQAVERILKDRYGCTTVVPDYTALTAATTGEGAASFQAFHPGELLLLINMFEEMPQGYHAVPGLAYLLRRHDGVPHPMYPLAPAVAWALPSLYPGGSYIEFMESGFTANPDDTHRLIIHEKAHFLWGYVFSAQLKAEWATLGGWYLDPTAISGWSTTNELEFVSAYAHSKNPNEDMAESLAYYILNPAALQSRSPAKYAFIRDRVMHGDRYLSTLPSNLTFEVLNLHPDYTYPGKIRRVDITVNGAADQDKDAIVELELNTAQNVFAGASNAYLRLFSSIGTYIDVWLFPTNASGSVLSGHIPISRYAKSGLWRPDQIVINDAVGNQRLAGVNDCGWRLWVDNSQEDVVKPQYVPNSLQVQVLPDTVTEADGAHPVYRAHITWQVNENRSMGTGNSVHVFFSNPASYSLQNWGTVNAQSVATVDIILTDFDASGGYGVPSIMMIDAAGNQNTYVFSNAPGHEPMTVTQITTATPDSQPPEVSLNDLPAQGLHQIQVSATPTNPNAPDGETMVVIHYQARDNASGLGTVTYRLLDPQGISHMEYHYHPNAYTTFFQGSATAWQEYTINVVLPTGSAPGTWGLQELNVSDKAGNLRNYNFVETMHFVVQAGP